MHIYESFTADFDVRKASVAVGKEIEREKDGTVRRILEGDDPDR